MVTQIVKILFGNMPNQIYKAAYGTHGSQGWQIDHIKPQSRGGSNAPVNHQLIKVKKIQFYWMFSLNK